MIRTSLLIAAGAAGAFLFLAGIEQPQASAQINVPSRDWPAWPPRPQDIVTLEGSHQFQQANESLNIFDVPSDSWLIITDALGDGGTTHPFISEDLNGVTTRKLSRNAFALGYSSGVGLAFSPGSSVVIKLDQGGSGGFAAWDITGYLVRTP